MVVRSQSQQRPMIELQPTLSLELNSTRHPLRALADWLRWQHLLRSCRLDPDLLERPIAEPGSRDFIICGIPRSGTSLLAALLFRPPEIAVCMEPWDGLRLAPAPLFASIRQEIAVTGRLSRGRLDLVALHTGEVKWHRDGAGIYPVELEPSHLLAVKWPGFWRYLDLLPNTKFLVCVRHPFDVIRSFEQTGGRLGAGLEYHVAFYRRMNRELTQASKDVQVRRVLLYQHVAERILPHIHRPQVLLIHFERWESEPARVLTEISSFLEVDLPPQPQVPIRVPERTTDWKGSDMVRSYCPSAVDLGYDV
jgi:hypothetical protein